MGTYNDSLGCRVLHASLALIVNSWFQKNSTRSHSIRAKCAWKTHKEIISTISCENEKKFTWEYIVNAVLIRSAQNVHLKMCLRIQCSQVCSENENFCSDNVRGWRKRTCSVKMKWTLNLGVDANDVPLAELHAVGSHITRKVHGRSYQCNTVVHNLMIVGQNGGHLLKEWDIWIHESNGLIGCWVRKLTSNPPSEIQLKCTEMLVVSRFYQFYLLGVRRCSFSVNNSVMVPNITSRKDWVHVKTFSMQYLDVQEFVGLCILNWKL
jgi:hypothetical protein